MLRQTAKENCGIKKKLNRKKGLKEWPYSIAKITNERRDVLKNVHLHMTGDETEYENKTVVTYEVSNSHRGTRNCLLSQKLILPANPGTF